MAPRARCGICLGLSSNSEASGIFYDISKPLSQEPLVADNFTPTPMPEPVVEYLNNLAEVRPMNFDEQNMSTLQPYKDDMQPVPPVEVDPEQYTSTSVSAEEIIHPVDDPSITDVPLGDSFLDDLIVEPNENDGLEDDEDRRISEQIAARELRGESDNVDEQIDQINSSPAETVEEVTHQEQAAAVEAHYEATRDEVVDPIDTSSPIKRLRSGKAFYTTYDDDRYKMVFHTNKVATSKITSVKAYNINFQ